MAANFVNNATIIISLCLKLLYMAATAWRKVRSTPASSSTLFYKSFLAPGHVLVNMAIFKRVEKTEHDLIFFSSSRNLNDINLHAKELNIEWSYSPYKKNPFNRIGCAKKPSIHALFSWLPKSTTLSPVETYIKEHLNDSLFYACCHGSMCALFSSEWSIT